MYPPKKKHHDAAHAHEDIGDAVDWHVTIMERLGFTRNGEN